MEKKKSLTEILDTLQYIPSDRDFPEEFPFNNGNTLRVCYFCKLEFRGYKDRYICKLCITKQLNNNENKQL